VPVDVVADVQHRGVRVAAVRAEAHVLLAAVGESAAEMAVCLVDDARIRDLNRRYRGKRGVTDVLAFAMREGPRAPGDEHVLRDVVISLDAAVRQARRRGRSVAAEVRRLLVHGMLHLLGYDHERSAVAARAMRSMERRLLRQLRPTRGRSA